MANDIDAALGAATEKLNDASATPRLDAELLMAHALQMERGQMLLRRHDLEAPPEFAALVARRAGGEPVAYIRGVQEFWDLTFSVTPDVLIPRADSETLIDAAQRYFENRPPPRSILDLGTGSGALVLTALSLFPLAQGTAVDASAAALAVANDNAETLGFADRCSFGHASWRAAGWADGLGQFDLILCNPPYVETDALLDRSVSDFEPAMALFSGADGLDDYAILIPQIPALLTTGGIAIFELGKGQCEAVSKIARKSGLKATAHHDLAGIERALALRIDTD
jgi:release factor glutamine methyltransferase